MFKVFPQCPLCPRLVAFRCSNAKKYKDFFNGAVPSFGGLDASLLVVGLAPGLKGANATGRPFTGDFAGDILYAALTSHGFAEGIYAKHRNDGLKLRDVRITNAVRCVPPENKPELDEILHCNAFLRDEIAAMQNLKVILTLGNVSHGAVLRALGCKQSTFKFMHAAEHVASIKGNAVIVINSYHTSRYNIQTRRLTIEMFDSIISRAKQLILAG